MGPSMVYIRPSVQPEMIDPGVIQSSVVVMNEIL